MVNYRVLLCVLLVFVLVPSVHAAATIADIYKAPSEATRLYSSTNISCQNGPTMMYCSDDQYGSSTDTYTVLGDGSTSAASGTGIADKGNTQSAILKLVYDLDGLIAGGEYLLRFSTPQSSANFNYQVCAYLEDDHNVNTSSCIDLNHTAGDSGWVEGDIDAVVRESAYRFDNRIKLRVILVDLGGADSVTVTEAYLKRPFKSADFSIVPGGVSETEINHVVRNTWAIVSSSAIPAITDASCDLHKMPYINESISDINISQFNPQYEVGAGNEYFSITWFANGSVPEMEEGFNYEIFCSGYLGTVYMDGFSQFVYVNREKSLWESIADIVAYLLQILGFTEDTNQLVSGRAEMVDAQAAVGETPVLTTFLTYADGAVDVNASCFVDVWYPNGTQWIDNQEMTGVGADGRYTYTTSAVNEGGLYQLRSFCNGTALMNRTQYAYANLEAFNGVIMQMVSN